MRKATGLLALCGAALTAGWNAAADPTIILDTYGSGANWNVGGTLSASGAVGFHGAVGSVNAPSDTAAHAAYAVLPFTVTSLPAGKSQVATLEIVFNIQPPTGDSSHVELLYGAIFKTPAGGAAALNSTGVTQVGPSFQFDTSGSVDLTDVLHGSANKGNGITGLLPALNLAAAGITLTPGSYFLVIEPKNGIGPAATDTLLDYGLWIEQSAVNIQQANPNLTVSGGALTNSYVSVAQAMDTFKTGSNGDGLTLQSLIIGRKTVAYFGARLSVDAPKSATVTGKVSLEGVSDLSTISPAAPLGLFHVSFRQNGTEVKGFDVPLTNLGATGTFTVTGAPAGTFDINIKGPKNLAVTVPAVNVSGAVSLPGVSLPAADSNNDNSVDSTDFTALIGSFNSDATIAGSGYDPTADFNFDGAVDSSDFTLLIGQFNNVGQ